MSRIIVHPTVKNEYMDKLTKKTALLKVGPGNNTDTDVTPLISKEQLKRVSNYCKSGVQSGANLVSGGEEITNNGGNFYEPTIFDNVDRNSTIAQEEIFGPVAVVLDFETDEEAIDIINSTDYGLASGIFTSNDRKAKWISERIEAGIVWHNDWFIDGVNLPGGGYKKSG